MGEEDKLIKKRKGGFRVYIKQKGRDVYKRQGFLLRVFIIFSSCQMKKGNFHRWIRLKRCWTGCTAGGNIFMKRVLALSLIHI